MKHNFKTRLLALLLGIVMMIMFVSCSTTNSPETNTPPTNDPETEAPSNPDENASPDNGTEEEEAPTYPANGAKKIASATKNFYVTAQASDTIDVAYYEDTPEILLVSTDVLTSDFFKGLLASFASFEIEETEDTYTIKRDNGAYCSINFVEDTIMFNNFDLFCAKRSDSMSDIISHPYLDSKGNSIYFKTTGTKDIEGKWLYLSLADYNIPLDIYEGKKYMPLQTLNDMFLVTYTLSCVYNGKDVYLASAGRVDASLEEQYYSVGPTPRSEALAEFTFNEFSLAMDTYYGLKDEHGVDIGFSYYMYSTGLYDDLLSTDAATSTLGLVSLAFGYLADKHTSLTMSSPYSGSATVDKSKAEYDPSVLNYVNFMQEFQTVRATVMSDGTPAYQEIGNTAYITFDSFTLSLARYQDYSEQSFQIGDTLGLIIYAHSMITREDSPIENVVIDLSCNGGGAADAAVYVVAWMLGYCNLSMTNPMTNGFSTTSYVVDVNLDGVFDSKDTVADKNLYCITSPVSFSCGNLVPALLKESGRVTMLGGTSGGGACAVNYLTLADGSGLCISSPLHLTVVSNGAYYTIDRGVEPHYYFTKVESYYERDSLTEFINNLR